MEATDFLLAQTTLATVGLFLLRDRFRKRWLNLAKLLSFIAALSFYFDYIANDRAIWTLPEGWNLYVLLNPLENSLFAITMATHLVLLQELLAHHMHDRDC